MDNQHGIDTWQGRLINEHAELGERIGRLAWFQTSPEFRALPEADALLLVRQLSVMNALANILAERIARIGQ